MTGVRGALTWQEVFRAFMRRHSTAALRSLAVACRRFDNRLILKATVFPDPRQGDRFAEACCPISWLCWADSEEDVPFVRQVDHWFIEECLAVDRVLRHRQNFSASCVLIGWLDERPRLEVLANLASELEQELAVREASVRPVA